MNEESIFAEALGKTDQERAAFLDQHCQDDVELRRRLEGKPLTGAKVVGLTALPQEELLESAFFTVAGLNPLRTRELLFYHKGKGLGKVVPIRGNETEPLGVQLDPCGFIFGRLVDKDGKPVAATTLA